MKTWVLYSLGWGNYLSEETICRNMVSICSELCITDCEQCHFSLQLSLGRIPKDLKHGNPQCNFTGFSFIFVSCYLLIRNNAAFSAVIFFVKSQYPLLDFCHFTFVFPKSWIYQWLCLRIPRKQKNKPKTCKLAVCIWVK